MNKFSIIILFLISILSCEKDTELSDNEKKCRKEHFYYTPVGEQSIENLMQTDFLLIGFEKSHANEEIIEFLNTQKEFENNNLVESFDISDYDYKLVIRKFKTSKSCVEISEIIQNLQSYDIVSFAAYTYTSVFCVDLNCKDLMSYCNEIMVSLNDTSDIDKLYKLVENTNTRIIEENGLYTKIGVDKNSLGNALQMANYFYETGLFYFADPNFHNFTLE